MWRAIRVEPVRFDHQHAGTNQQVAKTGARADTAVAMVCRVSRRKKLRVFPLAGEEHAIVWNENVVENRHAGSLGELGAEFRGLLTGSAGVPFPLALVEDMSYKEIAATLSIPLGTVMSRLHRARRALSRRPTMATNALPIRSRPEKAASRPMSRQRSQPVCSAASSSRCSAKSRRWKRRPNPRATGTGAKAVAATAGKAGAPVGSKWP